MRKIPPALVGIRPATIEEAKTLKPWSNSRLVDINHCPVWGIVHGQRKYDTTSRSMALECGETMHQMFAAVRIWQLEHVQGLKRHAKATANRIFGKDRWKRMIDQVDFSLDEREQLMQLGFAALHTSGYEDNPDDDIRTLSNMELATINYVDEQLPKMEGWPIWIANRKDPNSAVGIEQVFDAILEYEDGKLIRFIGTLDGLVLDAYRDNRITLDENKTASRLDDAWKFSFDLSHQITGYLACGSALFGLQIEHARVTGLKIKPTNRGEDVYPLVVSRTPDSIIHWTRWVRHTVDLADLYQDDYENAPRFTHSCNRYFRPCSLVPFCTDTKEGRVEQFAQMVPIEGSPSERSVALRLEDRKG